MKSDGDALKDKIYTLGEHDTNTIDPVLKNNPGSLHSNEYFRHLDKINQAIEKEKGIGGPMAEDSKRQFYNDAESERSSFHKVADHLDKIGDHKNAEIYRTHGPRIIDAMQNDLMGEKSAEGLANAKAHLARAESKLADPATPDRDKATWQSRRDFQQAQVAHHSGSQSEAKAATAADRAESDAKAARTQSDAKHVGNARGHEDKAVNETIAGNHKGAEYHYDQAASEHSKAASEASNAGDSDRAAFHKQKASEYASKSNEAGERADADERHAREQEHQSKADGFARDADAKTQQGSHAEAAKQYQNAASEHAKAGAGAKTAGDTESARFHEGKAADYTRRAAASDKSARESRGREYHANADRHAQAAHLDSANGRHADAADHYTKAASEHTKAAAEARAGGDTRSAQYHEDKARNYTSNAESHRSTTDGYSKSGRTSDSGASAKVSSSTQEHLNNLGLKKMPESISELKTAYHKKVMTMQESFRANATPAQQAVAAKVIASHEKILSKMKASGMQLSRSALDGFASEWVEFIINGHAYRAPRSAAEAITAPKFDRSVGAWR